MPVRDALDNIRNDHGCNDNNYTPFDLMTCQTHIVHQGRPEMRRNRDSGALGDRTRRELSFVHSKLKTPIINCEDKKEVCSNEPQFLS